MRKSIVLFLLIFALFSCTVRKTLYVEVVKPSEKAFPIANRTFTLFPCDWDFDDDNEIDSTLTQIFAPKMNLGFQDLAQSSPFFDTTLFQKGPYYTPKEILFDSTEVVDWSALRKLTFQYNADYAIILSNLRMHFNEDVNKEYYDGGEYYQKVRTVKMKATFSLYHPFSQSKLDEFNYEQSFYWDGIGLTRSETERDIASLKASMEEVAYWMARDYFVRYLPTWEQESRYLYVRGNANFRMAFKSFDVGDYEKARQLWLNETNNKEPELAARAYANLAYVSEVEGELKRALEFALKAYKIKPKTLTKQYIIQLKNIIESKDDIDVYFAN